MSTIRMNVSSDPFISCMDWMSRGQSDTNQFVYVKIDEKKQSISITEETEEYKRRFRIPVDRIEVPDAHAQESLEYRIYLSKLQQIKERFWQRSINEGLRFEFRTHTLTVYRGNRSIMVPIERVSGATPLKQPAPAATKRSSYRSGFALGQWVVTEEFRNLIENTDKPTVKFQIGNQMMQVLGFHNETFADTSFEVEVRRDNLQRFFHGLELPCTILFDLTENGPVRLRTLESEIGQEMEMAAITSVPVFVSKKRSELPAVSTKHVVSACRYLTKLVEEPFPIKQDLLIRVEPRRVVLAIETNEIKAQVIIPLAQSYSTGSYSGILKAEAAEEFCKQLQSTSTSELTFDTSADSINIQGLQACFRAATMEQWPIPKPSLTPKKQVVELTLGKIRYFSNVIRNQAGHIFSIESNEGLVQIAVDTWVIRKKRMSKSFAKIMYRLPFVHIQSIVQPFANTDAVIHFSNAYSPDVCFSISHNQFRYDVFLGASDDHLTSSTAELPVISVNRDLIDTDLHSAPTEKDKQTELTKQTEQSEQIDISSLSELFQQMDQWIGLKQIKEQCMKLVKYVAYERKRSMVIQSQETFPALHMCFTGNPGTGKTMTARMLGNLFKDIGVLEKGHVVEVDRQKLIGQHIGHTEVNFAKYLQQAIGGILFIDEAHSLYKQESPKDFGHDLIHVLVKAMEDYRDQCVVILAGYPKDMRAFLDSNIGLKDRIPFHFTFADYTTEELVAIAKRIAQDQYCYEFGHGVEDVVRIRIEKARVDDTFGNARMVRNLVEQAVIQHAARCEPIDRQNTDYYTTLVPEDFDMVEQVNERFQGVWEQLDQLVGLHNVKQTVRQIQDVLLHDQKRVEAGYQTSPALMHMCFTGNPGTGKTTVANLVASLLKEMQILKRGHLVEVSAKDLIAPYVGQSVHRTANKIREALGGVLFIDEAYALVKGALKQFGDEVLATLVKAMDMQRGNLVVIFAGYPKEIEELIRSNPGLKSRIQFHIPFSDYTASELVEIFVQKADQFGYHVPEDVQHILWEYFIACTAELDEAKGNGRLAEHTFESTRMNLASRTRELADLAADEFMTFCCEDIPVYSAE